MSVYIAAPKLGSNIWIANKIIGRLQPENPQLKVLIADLYSHPLRNRNKVDAAKFFPSFCKVLSQNGIGSIFVYDVVSMERNLLGSGGRNILINLIAEGRDNNAYNVSSCVLKNFDFVFNPYNLAQIVGSREVTNRYLSSRGVSVPSSDRRSTYNTTGRRVFSMRKTGYPNTAIILDSSDEADNENYNTEFIDTRIQFGDKIYYTSVRIMCIGTRAVKFVIRARDCSEQRPEARDANTPLNVDLIRFLYVRLVEKNLKKLLSLTVRAGTAYGPGFYAHDVVIDKDSGDPYLCETELKFFPDTFMKKFQGLLDNEAALFSTVSWKEYAKISAHHFMKYLKYVEHSSETRQTP